MHVNANAVVCIVGRSLTPLADHTLLIILIYIYQFWNIPKIIYKYYISIIYIILIYNFRDIPKLIYIYDMEFRMLTWCLSFGL